MAVFLSYCVGSWRDADIGAARPEQSRWLSSGAATRVSWHGILFFLLWIVVAKLLGLYKPTSLLRHLTVDG
jgi:hypothetical protein